MSVEKAFTAQALATAGLTAILGAGTAMRLYPHVIPASKSLPAAAYSLISDTREHAMGADVGVRHARIQVTCLATTDVTARDLAAAFSNAFSRQRGTWGTVVVQDVRVQNESATRDSSDGLEAGYGTAVRTLDLLFDYEG